MIGGGIGSEGRGYFKSGTSNVSGLKIDTKITTEEFICSQEV